MVELHEVVEEKLRVAYALVEASGIGKRRFGMGRIGQAMYGLQVESLRNDADAISSDIGCVAGQRLGYGDRKIVEPVSPTSEVEVVERYDVACHVATEWRIAELGHTDGMLQLPIAA